MRFAGSGYLPGKRSLTAEDDELLRDYSKLLNRLSGLADEMSSYFRRMKQQKEDMG